MLHVALDDGAAIGFHGRLCRECTVRLGDTKGLSVKGSLAQGKVEIVEEVEGGDLLLTPLRLDPRNDEVNASIPIEVER